MSVFHRVQRNSLIYENYKDHHLKTAELNLNEQSCIMEEPNFLQTSWNSLLTYIDKQPSVFSNCVKTSKLSDPCQNCSCKTNYEVERRMLSEQKEKDETNRSASIEDFGGPYEDDFISSLSNWLSEEHCKKLVLGSVLSPPPIIKEETHSLTIPGLHCKTNQTLKFFALDSHLHEDFSTHLGINFTTNIPKYTGAVIIDPVAEERYILNQPISRGALVSFIYNFTYNQLPRYKISHVSHLDDCEENQLCINNLNANNYEAVTHQTGQTYVVLHYTHNCGACSAISHLLLSCMHITSDISALKFAKIDNSLNTLPWHLTFDIVPTIVMYPAFKKSESRVLDITSPITIQSLMVLISYGLSPSDRLKLAMKVCDLKCQKFISNQSVSNIRKMQLAINDINLRYKRYIVLLVTTKEELSANKTLSYLRYKYELLLNLKHIQNYKLRHLKNKVRHLKTLSSQYPKVPYNFSTLLSYETYISSQGSKSS